MHCNLSETAVIGRCSSKPWMVCPSRPIVRSEDRGQAEFRHTFYFDADGNLVCHELHNYSKQAERWTPTGQQQFRPDAGATEEIGLLDWTVYDGKTAEVLDQGHTTLP